MKRLMGGFAGVAVSLMALASYAQSTKMSVTGYVTDTLSGKPGANALHSEASKRNVAAGMAKYAVYDEKTQKLYVLDPQATGAAYVGQRVTVTGTLGTSVMRHAGQSVDPQSGEAKDFHHAGQDSTTPIGGVLTISSIAVARPGPPAKATTGQ
jgi:hypothetical protein